MAKKKSKKITEKPEEIIELLAAPEPKPAAEATTEEDAKEQINFYVPSHIKHLFQQEADLAYEYKWIDKPSMTKLFIWMTERIANHIKIHISLRREQMQAQPAKEEERGG